MLVPPHISTLMTESRLEEAITELEAAIFAEPKNTLLWGHKGICLRKLGRYEEAEAVFLHLITLRPDNASAWNSLGNLLKEAGRIEEALPALEKAARHSRKPEFFSDWLFALNYSPVPQLQELYKDHLDYRALVGTASLAMSSPVRTEGRLRLAFVSADFCRHSVSYFFRPLLRHLDRQRFEVTCYSDVAQPDHTTELIRGDAEHWLDTHLLSHAELETRVRGDGIDILVDLSGHTGGNRLPVFARRPAPLQLSWLGYPNTTGLDSIDFRLVDAFTDPEGEGSALHTETLLRLPGHFVCYEGVSLAKPAELRPVRPFTFGCFNYAAKINGPLLELWAAILRRCTGSRLLLKNKAMGDAHLRSQLQSFFETHGIEPARLAFVGPTATELDHLTAYREMDLALDTHPYNGTTTTCEALWMGVPVLTMRGDRHASRVGASLLNAVGLFDFVAGNPDDYVQRAVCAFQGSLQRPEPQVLRRYMESSPLCNAPHFAASFNQALLAAWEKKFATLPVMSPPARRSLWLNGTEVPVEGELSPRVLDCALSVSQSMPEGRILMRALADGSELGADQLESTLFQHKLELYFAWDAEWLKTREADLETKLPDILAHARRLAGELPNLPPPDLLRALSAFLQELAPLLEIQAQRLEWQAESGAPVQGTPLASHHEALSALINRVIDVMQPPQHEVLRQLLSHDLQVLLDSKN